jgi:calmodulin
MDVIQKAAKAYGTANLDLRAVFEDFDSSGNGELSIEEMQSAFLALGVQLEVEQLVAVFNHFDPNGSGGVRVGEFVWAFFNRRGLVRQWRRRTDKLTDAQIRAKFHAADTSGDGKLSSKEFSKFLKSFGVVVTSQEQATLTAHFDTDGDGMLDLDEFKAFIVSEMMRLNSESNNLVVSSGARGGSGSSGASSPLHHSHHSPPTSNGVDYVGRRPQTAVLPLDMAGDFAAGAGDAGAAGQRAASAGSLVGAGPRAGRSRSLIEQESETAVLAPEFVASALRAQYHVEQKLGNQYY